MEELTVTFGQKLNTIEAMGLAIELAKQGVGYVSPNPPVGCVILDKNNNLIGAGYHKKFGGPHAEVEAINSVKNQSELTEAKIIVTLEPCAHKGKTPACSEMLSQWPIKKVIYLHDDPNPKVSGKGLKNLEVKDIHCEQLINEDLKNKNLKILKPFLINQKLKRSFIALKSASSFDGAMALNTGESQWITNEQSRKRAHYIRGLHDAILVGRNTIKIDNPQLNIRHSKFKDKELKIIILDPELKLLEEDHHLNIYKQHKAKNIIFVHKLKSNVPSNSDFKFIAIDSLENGQFNLNQLFEKLYRIDNLGSIMIEGGAGVYSSCLSQKIVDRFYLFKGGKILGSNSKIWSKGFEINNLSETIDFKSVAVEVIGNDVLVEAEI